MKGEKSMEATTKVGGSVPMDDKNIEHSGGRWPNAVRQADVDRAAKKLLKEGTRPSVEKIRQELGGRGSPNSLMVLLDRFYEDLGKRLNEEDAPDSVVALAREMWGTARAQAQVGVEERISEVKVEANAKVETAEAAVRETSEALEEITGQLTSSKESCQELSSNLSTSEESLGKCRESVATLTERCEAQSNAIEGLKADLRAAHDEAVLQREQAREREEAMRIKQMLKLDAASERAKEEEQRATATQAKLDSVLEKSSEATKLHAHAMARADATKNQLQVDLQSQAELLNQANLSLAAAKEDAAQARARAHSLEIELAESIAKLEILSRIETQLSAALNASKKNQVRRKEKKAP
jgi:chromosome segregation ATPase